MVHKTPTKGFTLVELLVVISIVALLGSIILPVTRRMRQQSQAVVCSSNLRQWNLIFQAYGVESDGQFFRGIGQSGFWWITHLDDKVRDWQANRIWFCPNAKKPLFDQAGRLIGTWNITNAWGIFYDGSQRKSLGPRGISGSYGVNGYFIRIPKGSKYQSGVKASDGWRSMDAVKQPANVPLYVDALRFDLWPRPMDPPAQYEFSAWTANNHMARTCINRHLGTVGSTFADGSTRRIGLKELWKLKWYHNFNTNGPWTLAGGVKPEHWPDWLRSYPDY